MPPIRFPAAISRFPCAAAETVIASSGRLPAIERRTRPPSSSPSPSRASSASVVLESEVPAIQVATAATRKTRRRRGDESPLTPKRCGRRRTEQDPSAAAVLHSEPARLALALAVDRERLQLVLLEEAGRHDRDPARRDGAECRRPDPALERRALAEHRSRPHLRDALSVDLDPEHTVQEEVEVVALRPLLDEHLALLERPSLE